MSDEKNLLDTAKEELFDKKYTRRQFLKLSGKGIAGVAISASLLNLVGCGQEQQIKDGEVFTWATPTGLLVVNKAKCVGCQRCEMNCNLVNDGKVQPFLSRLHLRDNYFFGENLEDDFLHNPGIQGNYRFEPITCKQCATPWCGDACPENAIYADEKTGARVVDKEKCIACGACVQACPWHMPRIDVEGGFSTKCINCGACVEGCITGAITMEKWEDVATALYESKSK